jgi:hypothetical protein
MNVVSGSTRFTIECFILYRSNDLTFIKITIRVTGVSPIDTFAGCLVIGHHLESISRPVEWDILLGTKPMAQNYLVFLNPLQILLE